MFYGVREMKSTKGVPTNATYGFFHTLIKIMKEYDPQYLAVAFDEKGPTFRNELYEKYKHGRDAMPEDLEAQVPIMKKLLDAMNIHQISLTGYEADDIIGTIAAINNENNIHTYILTGDRDSFQLVSSSTTIIYTKRGITEILDVNQNYINDTYGVLPEQLIDVKSLMGDKSDNIPGVMGIGEKTAIKLIKKYGTLKKIYDKIDEMKGKQKEKLIHDKDNAFLSYQLGKIVTDAPLEYNIQDCLIDNPINEKSTKILLDLEFKKILERYNIDVRKTEPQKELKNYKVNILNDETVDSFFSDAIQDGKCFCVWYRKEQGFDFALLSNNAEELFVYSTDSSDDGIKDILSKIKHLLIKDDVTLISNNIKELAKLCYDNDFLINKNVFDIGLAAYILEPSTRRYDTCSLASQYLDLRINSIEEIFKIGTKKIKYENRDKKQYYQTLGSYCSTIKKLYEVLNQQIVADNQSYLFENIETPLMFILADIEHQGFKVDENHLLELSEEYDSELTKITQEIYRHAGQDNFNINSTKQLGKILFEDLELPIIKKTKTGYSTSIEVLEKLKTYHPIIDLIIQYRMYSKLDSTYVKGMLKYIGEDDHKIHTTFNQTLAATGRLSSTDPNLQNIPMKYEMGRRIRKVFIPRNKDYTLVSADYSQIELRLLAHITEDDSLIASFVSGEDIHSRTASEIFDIDIEEVSRVQRSTAKAINFGLMYGKQAFGLSKDLNISRKEAQNYIDMYFSRYPKVQAYMKSIPESAKEKGYVSTLWGRRRYIPEINSKNNNIRMSGERMALNAPIQGSAADIMKLAMLNVFNTFAARDLSSKIILQVHDELIIDTYKPEIDTVREILKYEMENVTKLLVPLTVDINEGDNWYDCK
jgi:DNA polymerase-1